MRFWVYIGVNMDINAILNKYANADTGVIKKGQYNNPQVIETAKKCLQVITTENSKYPNGFRLPLDKFEELFGIKVSSPRNAVYQLNNLMKRNSIKLHFGTRTVEGETWIAVNPL